MARRKSSLDAHMAKGRAMAEDWYAKQIEQRRKQIARGVHVDQDVLLRHVIDTLPGTTLMSASIADYWLRWDKSTGAKRRQAAKPKSVFSNTRPKVANKDKVLAWAYQWVEVVGAQAMLKEVRGVRNLVALNVQSQIAEKFPFMCFGAQVMGGVEDVSVDAFRQRMLEAPAKVSLRELTMEQALLRSWTDHTSRARWFVRWDEAQKKLLADLRQAVKDEEDRLLALRRSIDRVGLAQSGRKRPRPAKPEL